VIVHVSRGSVATKSVVGDLISALLPGLSLMLAFSLMYVIANCPHNVPVKGF